MMAVLRIVYCFGWLVGLVVVQNGAVVAASDVPNNPRTATITDRTRISKQPSVFAVATLQNPVMTSRDFASRVTRTIHKNENSVIRSMNHKVTRGGGGVSRKTMTKVLLGIGVGWIVIKQLPSKAEMESWILIQVTAIQQLGSLGRLYYTLLLATMECLGINTTVYETTGGMIYGVPLGVALNGIGKLSGATLTYVIGRTFFRDAIQARLTAASTVKNKTTTQTIQSLVTSSIVQQPFRQALWLRFSILPQLVKNLTLSVVLPKSTDFYTVFLPATCLHCLPYSLLWTLVGHASLQTPTTTTTPTPTLLKGIVLFVTLFGIFGSPTLTAWWIQQMIHDSS